MSINWSVAIPAFSAALLTILGWSQVNRYGERRDRKNKIRELRTQYLAKACRVFIRAGLERDVVPTAKEMEDAVADIYLFGTPEQIALVRKFVGEFAERQTANMDALLASLRNDLREELALPPLHENPALLRVQLKQPISRGTPSS